MLRVLLPNILTLATFMFGLAGPVAAQEAKDADTDKGGGDLTTAATNPVGALIQVQLQDLYIPNSRNSEGYANTAIIQPVIPISLGTIVIFKASSPAPRSRSSRRQKSTATEKPELAI